MNEHQHGHIPYLALLFHFLEEWKQEHEGQLPSSYKEKNEFKKLLMAGMRTDVAGGSEENFEEAVAAVLKNMRPHEISSSTREVLEDEKCRNLSQDVCTPPCAKPTTGSLTFLRSLIVSGSLQEQWQSLLPPPVRVMVCFHYQGVYRT